MNQGMNPYQAPTTQTLSQQVDRDWKWLLFSFDGRIGRGEYWKASILLGLGVAGLLLAVAVPLGLSGMFEEGGGGTGAMIMGIVAVAAAVPLLWSSLAIGVKRWHDRGKSGAWVLIGFIPYIGSLWVLVECGCLRGTEGPNTYGPDPLA